MHQTQFTYAFLCVQLLPPAAHTLNAKLAQLLSLNRVNTIHHSSNHANCPILFHSIVSHRIGESYCIIQMLVGLLNLGDADTTHVGNLPKHHLFTVSGVWMNRRIRSKGKRV